MAEKYTPEYFMDEVRDGFFVPGFMKKSWAVDIKNYKKIEEFCDKHSIAVTGTWGSLLGPVRHGGFIPWDDDIDLAMIHSDYNRMMTYVEKDGLPGEGWISDYVNNEDDNAVRRWMESPFLVRKFEDLLDNYGFPFTSLIDIFIMDYVPPEGSKDREYYGDVVDMLIAVKHLAKKLKDEEKPDPKEEKELEGYLKQVEKVMDYSFDRNSPKAIYTQLLEKVDEFLSGYNEGNADRLAIVAYYFSNSNRIVHHSFYDACVDLPFERDTLRVPVGYDGILRRFWPDFVAPRLIFDSHGYPAYASWEKEMFRTAKYELIKYRFYRKEYEGVLAEKQEKVAMTETVASILSLLTEAHEEIGTGCQQDSEREAVIELLGQCQEMAVMMGEMLEQRALGDVNLVISILEQYCDEVFSIYERLQGLGDSPMSAETELIAKSKGLSSYPKRLEEACSGLREKKQVVFLCYRSEHWQSLHTVWEQAMQDESASVVVIAVPYYYRDGAGTPMKDDMQLETDGFPSDVTLTPYDSYDFEMNHPDIVIYQCPYDEYDNSFTVHPYFYLSNIRKYAEKLVLVSPFTLRYIEPEDSRSRISIRNFTNTPGSIYADQIIVQSENLREVFVENLNQFIVDELESDRKILLKNETTEESAGEKSDLTEETSVDEPDNTGDVTGEIKAEETETEEDLDVITSQDIFDWEKTICGVGSACYDWEKRRDIVMHDTDHNQYFGATGKIDFPTVFDKTYDMPGEWVSRIYDDNGKRKKILLFFFSGSMLFEHELDGTKKLQRQLEELKKYNEDLVVWWCPDPLCRQILRRKRSGAWNAYRRILEEYSGESTIILDDSGNEDRAVAFADAMFGDAGTLMNRCQEMKKPVLWETPPAFQNPETPKKLWPDEITITIEQEGDLEGFVEELLKSKCRLPDITADENGKAIWNALSGSEKS